MERQAGLSRRALFGAGAGLAATAALGARGTAGAQSEGPAAQSPLCSLLPPERIGLQLYSLRTPVAEIGFAKVLEYVAQLGYRQIEFAGYTQGTGPITLPELRRLLDENGLVAAGSHIDAADEAAMAKVLDDAEVLGIPHVGFSLLLPDGPPTTAGWAAAAQRYNAFGEQASKRGIGFYFHNHFQEWLPLPDDPSRRGIDVLLAETDPRHVHWEMDVYWAYVGHAQSGGGFDPLNDYAVPHRDRIKLFHVKDGRPEQNQILDVGEGAIDFQAFFTTLFAQAPDQVERHMYLWERDSADDHPRGALAAARSSFVNMRYGLVPGTCDSRAGFSAAIAGVGFRGRRLRVKLELGSDAEVTATLRRGGRELASAGRRVEAGRRTFGLRVPRAVRAGRAQLELVVKDGSGGTLTLRDAVRIPSRRRRRR